MRRKAEIGRDRKKYVLALAALGLLVAAALLAPRALFDLRDVLLCGDSQLLAQESMDVGALSTNYERSLFQRLNNFAEGLAGGKKFFVDERELELTEEVENILFSSDGLYQQNITILLEMGLLPGKLYGGAVSQYKQYVVYSDDFESGVNFILWFFEFAVDENRLYLLMDASDYTIYALKVEGNALIQKSMSFYYNFLEMWNNPGWLWLWYCRYLDIIDTASWDNAAFKLGSYTEEAIYAFETEQLSPSIRFSLEDKEGTEIPIELNNGKVTDWEGREWYTKGDGETLSLKLPLRENRLEFQIQLIGSPVEVVKGKEVSFPDVVLGVRELYLLIPEFQSWG